MSSRWVVDADHPQGYAVPMTPAEQAQLDADQAAAAAAAQTAAQRQANAAAMRQSLHDRMQQMLDLANAIEGGTATPADQRIALVLCLRGTVRLTRLFGAELDQAA